MITGDQIVAHAIGDYLLQSDWMATEKTRRSVAALAHVLTYFLPFLFLTQRPTPLAFIIVTHFVIDRWRLARYIVWAKNWIGPRRWLDNAAGDLVLVANLPWAECRATGYPPSRPTWLTVWLLIIADNTLHLICNGFALRYL